MPKPDRLPLDIEDLSDVPIFIEDWRKALERQVARLDEQQLMTDGYFLVIAAHQLLLVCRQYADHDPTREISGACDAFDTKHPHLRDLRNMLMHSDEYYRGQGLIKESQGSRTFTYFICRREEDWHLAQGHLPAGQCNLSQLARDGIELADRSLAATGPGESWLAQLSSGGKYAGQCQPAGVDLGDE